MQALVEICGVPAVEIKLLKDEIPLVQPFPGQIDHWVEAGLKQNLEILIQKLKAEISDKEVRRQKSSHYPTLDFQADYINKNTKGSLFGGGSDTTTYDFMVKLTIPIYEGGLVTSKTREAFNLYQSALQGVEKQSRAADRKVRASYNGVVSAITRVQAMKKSLDAQLLVVEAKEEGFKAGLYISLAVLDAMQDLYRYKKEYSQARNDYILNSFRLRHAVGTLKPEELNLVNAWLQN
jgi:outer membrane protein